MAELQKLYCQQNDKTACILTNLPKISKTNVPQKHRRVMNEHAQL